MPPTQGKTAGSGLSTFGHWQPQYGERGIALFPVVIADGQKKPAIKYWQRVGLPGSAQLAQKFQDSTAFGFCTGRRSRVTVLDIDSKDERVLTEALDRHGSTPIIVRSGSGNFQAWYRHNGERRLIRPFEGQPIDVLGGGYVVAPPSQGKVANYQFIEGGLESLENLPTMRGLAVAEALQAGERGREGATRDPTVAQAQRTGERVGKGARNNTLFKHCMREAHHCDDFDTLLDVARTRNHEFDPPMADEEVMSVAMSAWGYTERGENRFGTPGVFFPAAEINHLIEANQDALVLLFFLKANNGPDSTFLAANALADQLGWTRKRLSAARKYLEGGYIRPISPATTWHGATHYRWISKGGQK